MAEKLCVEDNPESQKVDEFDVPLSKAIIARTLGCARGSLYYHSRLEWKDKKLAVKIEKLHDEDNDTLGHKKLAPLLKTGKNRIRRMMKKYGLAARKRTKKYVYHGKIVTKVNNLVQNKHLIWYSRKDYVPQ